MQTTTTNEPQSNASSMKIYIVIAIVLVVIAGATYFTNQSREASVSQEQTPVATESSQPEVPAENELAVQDDEQTLTPVATDLAPAEQEAVLTEQPVIIEEPVEPLPALADSDELALASAKKLSWLPNYPAMLRTTDIIVNFVAFIDNLASNELVAKFSPLKQPAEKFSVIELGDKIYLNPESYNRYNIYVDVINSVNVEFAIELYQKLNPLFEQAYQELGYPEGAFDSALTQAIDSALDAPIIRDQIELVAPSAMYKFADPDLEQLPSAQKLMIRMGADNMIKLRPKLQQIQSALAAR